MNKPVNLPGGKGCKRRGDTENESNFKKGYASIKWGRDTDVEAAPEETHHDGGDMPKTNTGEPGTA